MPFDDYNRHIVQAFLLVKSAYLLLPRRLDRLNNLVHHTRVRKGRGITQAVFLSTENLPQDTSHDLTTPGLWQVIDNKDGLGCSERTDRFSDLHDQLFADLIGGLVVVFECDEGVDGLAGEFVVDADDGAFGDGAYIKNINILGQGVEYKCVSLCSIMAASISAVERR